jgi:holo-[acyl-carrier protein] synthase
MKIKNGVDIVNINRIKDMLTRYGEVFLHKLFTTDEINYCVKAGGIDVKSLAKRFAGKEAFAKALGFGIGEIAFKDIEILNDEFKAPYIKINDKIKNYVKIKHNWDNINVALSLSDDNDMALAFVIIHID